VSLTRHFVIFACFFKYIVGPSFIFDIFLYQRPTLNLHQSNFSIFKNLDLCFPHGVSPNYPLNSELLTWVKSG